ncbi:MAG: hypothetical protein V1834_01025 [Candidatus Micrarchaeota archaeon]
MKRIVAVLFLISLLASAGALTTKEKRVAFLAHEAEITANEFSSLPKGFTLEQLGEGSYASFLFKSRDYKYYLSVNLDFGFKTKEYKMVDGINVGFDDDGSLADSEGLKATKINAYYVIHFYCDGGVANEKYPVYFESAEEYVTDFDGLLKGLVGACLKTQQAIQDAKNPVPSPEPSPTPVVPSPEPRKTASPIPTVEPTVAVTEPPVQESDNDSTGLLIGVGAVALIVVWFALSRKPAQPVEKGAKK